MRGALGESDGLRVLGFCDHFSAWSSGGVERAAYEVYRRMAVEGAQVTVLAGVSGRQRKTAMIDGLDVVAVPALDLSRLIRAQALIAPGLLRRALALARTIRPDVLHANGLHFHSSIVAAAVHRRQGYPLVLTAQLAGTEALPRAGRGVAAAYDAVIGRRMTGRAETVIAVSPSVREHLVSRLGVSRERVVVVPNGVDHDVFHPAEPDSQPRRPTRILFVGRLIFNKGPELLLDGLSLLAGANVDFTAALLGDGPLRGRLEKLADQAPLAGRVSIVGRVDDVAERMRQADIVVRPSTTEGLPLALLEAMASGLCVVASDIPGNRDLIRHGENGLLFRPGDADSLAANLRRVVEDDRERRRLAGAAHRTSLGYSWDESAQATASALARAAGFV